MGIWGYLSSGKRGVRTPLELRLGSRVSSRVSAQESGLLSNCRRNSGFFSSCSWKHRVYWRVVEGTQSSSPGAARNQCSSAFATPDAGFYWSHGVDVRVLLKLGWYSGFLATCGGASC